MRFVAKRRVAISGSRAAYRVEVFALLVLVATALTLTLSLAGCRLLAGRVECADDSDCTGFGICHGGLCRDRDAGEGEGDVAGEGEGDAGEGEGDAAEGEGDAGEGEGEGEGELPAAILDTVAQITGAAQPAMCAGHTFGVDTSMTALSALHLTLSTSSPAVTASPPTLTLSNNQTTTVHIAWVVGAPPGLNAALRIHDDDSGADYAVPIHFTVATASSLLVDVPAAAKKDVLYVLDNSGSMSSKTGISTDVDAHITSLFAAPAQELRFAVTDTDDASGGVSGPFGDPRLCNAAFIDESGSNARNDLTCALSQLWDAFNGSGTESPLGAMVDSFDAAKQPSMAGFLRADATLHIVYVGDSPDQTPNLTATQAIGALDQLVVDGKTKAVHVHAIAEAGTNEDCAPAGADAKVSAVRDALEGEGASICDLSARTAALARIAARIRQPLESVDLFPCDSGDAIICVVDGDACTPISGAVESVDTCVIRIDPAAAINGGDRIFVAEGGACPY